MGLAAQQARLLTITSRKSDCEYQSMQLSHQKLSVARDLENISSEYQNSLSQTKLIYDYYGTGTSTDRLNYTMLMTPSTLNDYTPVTISAASGKVVLNTAYAAAAKAAGIPAEGLGTIPSSEVRNKFLQGLCSKESGLLTESVAKKFQEIPYNQYLGMGETGSETVYFTYQTQLNSGILNDDNTTLLDLLRSCTIELPPATKGSDDKYDFGYLTVASNGKVTKAANPSVTLEQLIKDETQYNLFACAGDDSHYPEDKVQKLNEYISGTFLQLLQDAFTKVLKTNDQRSTQALNYALTKMKEIMPTGDAGGFTPDNKRNESNWEDDDYLKSQAAGCVWRVKKGKASEHEDNAIKGAENYLGTVVTSHYKGGVIGKKFNSAAAVNLNNIAQAFLSYFVDFMSGIEGGNIYQPTMGVLDEKELVTKADPNYIYEIKDGEKTYDSDSARISQFYDTLLNQICINGWMENDNVLDADYLQKMIQNGSMFITRQKDDGFYYQINYGTDTYIKEVTDDEAVARAEAKYNTMKAKLSSKEQTIDLKMKNLDTEITSLTTEYDTIKNTLTKNIEKSFKRYSA